MQAVAVVALLAISTHHTQVAQVAVVAAVLVVTLSFWAQLPMALLAQSIQAVAAVVKHHAMEALRLIL
jgi:hypothetical protein